MRPLGRIQCARNWGRGGYGIELQTIILIGIGAGLVILWTLRQVLRELKENPEAAAESSQKATGGKPVREQRPEPRDEGVPRPGVLGWVGVFFGLLAFFFGLPFALLAIVLGALAHRRRQAFGILAMSIGAVVIAFILIFHYVIGI